VIIFLRTGAGAYIAVDIGEGVMTQILQAPSSM